MSRFSELLERARNGDEAALTEIYRDYAAGVRVAARRRLGPYLRRKLDSTDLVQSVFTEVLRDLPRFEDRGEGAFRRWLYIKTTNKVTSKLRRYLGPSGQRAENLLDSATPITAGEAGPSSTAAAREDRAHAASLLDDLDPSTREVVRLRLDQSLTFAQIAKRLGLTSEDAARKRYARAIGKLRGRYSA